VFAQGELNGATKGYSTSPYSFMASPIFSEASTKYYEYRVNREKASFYGPIYTWRTLTGVNLNNNWAQYSSPEFFWHCNHDTEPELH